MMAHFLYSRSTWLGAPHIYGPTVIRCLATVVAKVVATVAATAVAGAVLLALAGCSGGDMPDSMQLTAEETTATPPPVVEEGPIKFVWDAGNGQRTTLISTTTSTTSAPTETFIARQKIAEYWRKPNHPIRLPPIMNPETEGNTPPPSGTVKVLRLVPLDAGLVIRKRAEAAKENVTTIGITQN